MGYIKKFNQDLILTSKNPESFVYFTYNDDGISNQYISPFITSDISRGVLFVNGLDLQDYRNNMISINPSENMFIKLNATYDTAPFLVFTNSYDVIDKELFFYVFNSSDFTSPDALENINVRNRPYIIKNDINTFPIGSPIIDDESSYLLLRTNPKLSGNITLNVDGDENIYLDTFHVSDILNNKKYRKQQVSSNSVLSDDIRRTFSSLPLGEMFKVDSGNTLNISVPKTELSKQFIHTYNSGAKLLKDELYNEDNAILAPLWINSKIPDYFILFRMPGVYNPETYSGDAIDELSIKYLQNSDILQSWDLKETSPLGKYLHTHLNDIAKVQAPVFLSLTDPSQIESDPNTWYGMAIDKGIVTGRSETTYFFNQAANNYTDLNAFVTQGFERNNLLCPNLLNMNFMFNDDVSDYSMNRYFGLYVTENKLFDIAYYAENNDASISILSLDGKDSSLFFNSSIFDINGNILDNWKNRIFVINDGTKLTRFTNINDIKNLNSYANKPNNNIFSTNVDDVSVNPFMLISLNNVLHQGEHLRIINYSDNLIDASTIWEVYGTNSTCDKYVSYTPASGNHPHVYRTFFNTNGDISDQILEISKAFDLFSLYGNSPFGTNGLHGSNWLSIILNDDAQLDNHWVFQRITASTLNDINDASSGFNNVAKSNDISFFDKLTPNDDYYFDLAYNADYGPIDFEFFGNRKVSAAIPFIDTTNKYVYSFDSSKNILDKFVDHTLYQGIDNWYRKISDIRIYDTNYLCVKDPTSTKDKILIMTDVPIQKINSVLNAYDILPISISLMGINQVKDIDFNVNDPVLGITNEYNYNRNFDISTNYLQILHDSSGIVDIKGSFVIESGSGNIVQYNTSIPYYPNYRFNTFDVSGIIYATDDTLISYGNLDGVYDYSIMGGASDVSLDSYYDSSVLLKHGLIVPTTAKWVGHGNDVRNNPIRLFLNGSTNFIPNDTEFSQEISYPSFKYLSGGDRSWEDYVFYDINDVILDASVNISIKDAMLKYPYDDYFSKLIYTNHNVSGVKTRSSICYYNPYKNSIDVTLLGLNLSLSVENIASSVLDIKNYNKFRFSFISTSSKNKTSNRPIDLFINENTKTILMVWYQGNDELNYNRRYSSFLAGKSLLDASSKGFVTGYGESEEYCFVKSPFIVNNATIQKRVNGIYQIGGPYDSDAANPYAQMNINQSGFNSAWLTLGRYNTIMSDTFVVENDLNFDTFLQNVSYGYQQNLDTYGNYAINYGYNFKNNKNYYQDNTTNYNTLSKLLVTSKNYVMVYIIKGSEIFTSLDFGGIANPISIKINPPRNYNTIKTYNGWYKPKFNDVFKFNSNETKEIIESTNRDFTLGNTNLIGCHDLQQLWYNTVVSRITSSDVSKGNAISFIKNYNVFLSAWDASYYKRNDSYVNGYESGDEISSFFGSKLPKLPNVLTLDYWNNTTMTHTSTNDKIYISYNLTRAIINHFKNNSNFVANWSNFSNSNNAIDSYIKKTILDYYNISQTKIGVNYFYKPYDNTLIHMTNDNTFNLNINQNFNAQLVYLNNEYIYNIEITKNGNFSYFISLNITEK